MEPHEKELLPIDDNLYQFNIMYQLRLVESNRAELYTESEKEMILDLLSCCKELDGNKLQTIMTRIFDQSTLFKKMEPTALSNTHLANIGVTDTTQEPETEKSLHEIIEQELDDPRMRKVTVNIKQFRGRKRPQPKSLYKQVLKNEHKKKKRISKMMRRVILEDSNE